MLENYKIRVNSEDESKEAQELFFELGYAWPSTGKRVQSQFLFLIACSDGDLNWNTSSQFGTDDSKELTMPQLRDLVVLKRNSMDDQNHVRNGCVAYLDSEGYTYTYSKQLESWIKTDDEPINQPKDPALISGAEALDALKAKKEVEYCGEGLNDSWLSAETLPVVYFLTDSFRFRLKPQTIKIELELPKHFEPKDGDECFIFDSEQEDGFYRFAYSEDSGFHQNLIQFGVWRTEEEIKQVVEQLRKIRGV